MEQITTNGLGGYASSTVLGINTRKYHSLLVPAFNPPVDRRVLLVKLDEEIIKGNKTYQTGSNEFRDGIYPKGFQFISCFYINPFPRYQFSVDGVKFQKTIFMSHGKNATIVIYDLFNQNEEDVLMNVLPLVNSRHFPSVTLKNDITWNFLQRTIKQGVIIQPSNPISTLAIISSDGKYSTERSKQIRGVHYREEKSRGESCFDDNFLSGHFCIHLESEERKKFYIIASAGKNQEEAINILLSIAEKTADINAIYNKELEDYVSLLENFRKYHTSLQMKNWLKWLVLDVDSFLVNWESTKNKSIIAGYHWFADWGRDAMISLLGLVLVTRKIEDAKQILKTFKQYCKQGIISNHFQD